MTVARQMSGRLCKQACPFGRPFSGRIAQKNRPQESIFSRSLYLFPANSHCLPSVFRAVLKISAQKRMYTFLPGIHKTKASFISTALSSLTGNCIHPFTSFLLNLEMIISEKITTVKTDTNFNN